MLGPALRSSVAVAAPLVAGTLLGVPAVAQWSTLGALNASIVDAGGPYVERAIAISLATVLMGAAIAAGTLVGGEPLAAVPAVALVAALAALGRAFGEAGSSAGLVVAFAFLVGIGYPGEPAEALERGAALALGGTFALALSLALWPIRPYGPIESAVAAAFESAARFALAAGERSDDAALRALHAATRRSIESARARLGSLRAREDGTRPVAERLLVLLRAASRLSASTVALARAIEAASAHAEFASVRGAVAAAAEAIARAARSVADAIARGGGEADLADLDAAVTLADASVDAVRDAAPFPGARYQAVLDCRAVVRALESAERHVRAAADVASRLRRLARGRPARGRGLAEAVREEAARVRSQLTLGSVLLRHALRVGAAAAFTFALAQSIGLPRGYWCAITVLVVLQPDFGGTRRRAAERSLGTAIGAFAAPLLALVLPGVGPHIGAVFVLAFVFFSARKHRYWLGTAAITTMILLLIDLAAPRGFATAAERVGSTLAGAAVALVAGYQLWPSGERRRFPQQMSEALRASRDYFGSAIAAAAAGTAPDRSVYAARRRAEVEAGNAEASYQRLLAERESRRGDPLPLYALVTYDDRLCRAVTALVVHLETASGEHVLPDLETLSLRVVEALDEIAAAIASERAPAPLPPIEESQARLREHVRDLKARRIEEIRAGEPAETATKRAVLDTASVEGELDRIVREVVGIHSVAETLFGVSSSAGSS